MKPVYILSNREARILRMVCEGKSNKQIGAVIGLAEATINHLLSAVYIKIGVQTRTQAAIFAQRYGLDQYVDDRPDLLREAA